ncbi:MAG: 7-cyano-7-deazaguanine synthase [Rickettsiales bacterium]|jgi:7-cyano-7-deazaguanine synthase
MKKAIILLSGGLDSATVAAIAKQGGYEIYAISFDYGQRHQTELESAKKVAEFFKVKEHKTAKIDLRVFGGSALTDDIAVPKNQIDHDHIPVTYVPARNTIFLSYALGYAEIVGANDIFIGVNEVDYSGYPDCRGEFIASFEAMANLATARAVGDKNHLANHLKIQTPLINLSKKEIIEIGLSLGVDYSLTHSCYDPISKNGEVYSCGKCDSCEFRLKGFAENAVQDPVRYS